MAPSLGSCRVAASRFLLDFTHQHLLKAHTAGESDCALRFGSDGFDGGGQVHGYLCDGCHEVAIALYGAEVDVQREVPPVGSVAGNGGAVRCAHDE